MTLGTRARPWAAGALLFASATCGSLEARPTTITSADLQADDLRGEHASLTKRLPEVEASLASLAASSDAKEQRAIMRHLVVFFAAHATEHARWEEQGIFDVADRRVGGLQRATASLRHEHLVMKRWADELTQLASAEDRSARAFVRIAYELAGLMRGHVEAETATVPRMLDASSEADARDERLKRQP